ncbi:hypothetical protein NEUTE1DRAFT_141351 [Neurospora tetrasperma FGSC 2508]|uniref:Uncharacterized protein n=1 Tax=Neurospora tetrasperma (strain FGSC 2508 / ATCC MYA-4615 / P0657) TaxID=510951 RepID=F8MYK3_NEUT8|nr:uncharacterized protein NEUTE1DRAFT_141351 [Neurospora tetrasperma FGSC 2508]EGO51400.1 hypothetical protein NEUTE1DRAFT_141351 [Neurospora tetrasperma FGSC 2508]EGZ78630.1 hypothetical protein NEUTE2DRAFT_125140 [Neurospora tetrasperma FGSC 2509]
MTMDFPDQSKISAERACTSPLGINGVPQIIFFCNGSRMCERDRESEASSGGYRVVLRNPWASNVNSQEGAATGFTAASVPFGLESKSGLGLKSWSYTLVEQHRPESVVIELSTDSQERWHRLNRGLNH